MGEILNGSAKSSSGGAMFGECRNKHESLELETGENDAATEVSEVVLVGMAKLLEQTVDAQALEHVGDLGGGAPGEGAQIFVAQPADEELAAHEMLEEALVVGREEVQAAVRAPLLGD